MHAVVTRRPPCLPEWSAAIEGVLGRPLPEPFASFYAETDGLTVTLTDGADELGDFFAEIATLDDAFDGFKPHRQSEDVDSYDPGYDEAFCETVWSPDADVSDDEALARMNTLRRSKLVMSIPGAPEWIVVDLDPPEGGYRLLWAYEGSELHPLAFDFPEMLRWIETFGAARWYWAFLPEEVSDSHPDTVRAALDRFDQDAVDALLAVAAERR